MTTEVHILIQGNKACEVTVTAPQQSNPTVQVAPGSFTKAYISGDQVLTVKEVGDFLP